MTRILRIDSSGRHEASVTRRIADRVVARLGGEAVVRDLAEEPPVLVTEEIIGAYFTPPAERTDAQRAAIAPSDAAVAELQAADVIVIGLPVYNFGPPAALKGWADMVARVGVTFRYADGGPEGLLQGKRAIVAVASGGTESGSAIDHATPWLRQFLGFLGIEDVTVIAADQLGMESEEKMARAYDAAEAVEPLAA